MSGRMCILAIAPRSQASAPVLVTSLASTLASQNAPNPCRISRCRKIGGWRVCPGHSHRTRNLLSEPHLLNPMRSAIPETMRESRSDSPEVPSGRGGNSQRAVPILDNRNGPPAAPGKNRPLLSESARSQQTTAGGRCCTLPHAKQATMRARRKGNSLPEEVSVRLGEVAEDEPEQLSI